MFGVRCIPPPDNFECFNKLHAKPPSTSRLHDEVRRLLLIVYINISQRSIQPSKSFLIKETFDVQVDEMVICLTLARRYCNVNTTITTKALHIRLNDQYNRLLRHYCIKLVLFLNNNFQFQDVSYSSSMVAVSS